MSEQIVHPLVERVRCIQEELEQIKQKIDDFDSQVSDVDIQVSSFDEQAYHLEGWLASLQSEHNEHLGWLNNHENQISELESQGAYAEDDL